jgi:hypothetical protein
MADSSWLSAVPFGLVMFVGTTVGFAYRALRRRASRASFPELAKRLGLAYSAPETAGAAGVLKGEHRGFVVRIESELRSRVVAQLEGDLPLDLRNYERWVRLPPGLEPFAFPDRSRNAWLRTRLAAPGLGSAVTGDAALNLALQRLQAHPALREFNVSDGRVELVFDFGARGLFPIEEAERAVNVAVDIAARLAIVVPLATN